LRSQFLHRILIDLDQVCDVLVGVSRAHETMTGRNVQSVPAVEQAQASIGSPVPYHITCHELIYAFSVHLRLLLDKDRKNDILISNKFEKQTNR
jgi:hypothetical protein